MKPTNEIAPSSEQPASASEKPDARGDLGLGSQTLADVKQTLMPGKNLDRSSDADPQANYPKTFEGKRQEFADNFGKLGGLYGDSVEDPKGERFARFQQRMENVYLYDRQTTLDMGKLGAEMSDHKHSPDKAGQPDNGKPYAEQVGENIGEILRSTMARHPGDGPKSPAMTSVEGAISGIMLAARANFDADPIKRAAQDALMVNAIEGVLSKDAASNKVHAVIFDGTEPGLDIYPANEKRNRLDYSGK